MSVASQRMKILAHRSQFADEGDPSSDSDVCSLVTDPIGGITSQIAK
jgi:hypothetical protein